MVLVTRSQAAAFGFTTRGILVAKQRDWLTEPVCGVLVLVGHPPTWEQRLAIAIAATSAKPLVSNGASARLFGLDGFDLAPGEVIVLRPGRLSPRASEGIVVHRDHDLDERRIVMNEPVCRARVWHARWLISDRVSPRTRSGERSSPRRRIHRVNPLWLQQTAVRVHRPGQLGTGVMIRALRRWSAEGTLPTPGSKNYCGACSIIPTFRTSSRSTC